MREGGREAEEQLVSFRHFVSIHPGERILEKCHPSDQEESPRRGPIRWKITGALSRVTGGV